MGEVAHEAFHGLLLIFEEVLVHLILSRSDLILEHDIAEHEEGKRIAEAQNPARLVELIQSLHPTEIELFQNCVSCLADWPLAWRRLLGVPNESALHE